ncbi:glycoside hydrolase family 13 protein [Periconia macrospinosa]|uniref:alpha-amylase n=1 Tax=Periconia macrospinosa TaxID=97972 RepID=A0A2V1DVP9_9PLEO|nr:glycoside hydrolase family 13 protein [Periconia macrospinosa]
MKFGPLWALVLALTVAGVASAATLEQWRSRSIYQVLTDRFARSDISTTAKCNVTEGNYCGGTYQGIIKKLNYIQEMGFSAIWISPITLNIPEKTKFGYAWHGYWQQDLYKLNDHYGSAEDLKMLSRALHARGMYLMVDIVTNHNGWNGSADSVDYTRFRPFNDRKYYHDYCAIADYTDQVQVENCWLGDTTVPLPDLNTEDQNVRTMYGTWIKQLISNYSIDGLRLDTVKYVDRPFWASFQRAANIFATGEVLSSNITFACSYQAELGSVLNYPAYYAIIDFLNSTSGTTAPLLHAAQTFKTSCKDTSVLTTFTENHDLPRFASQTKDMALAKNALALTLLWDGIPIVYAGQEHHYSGYADPANREATWLSGYSNKAELYTLTRTLNLVRSRALALSPSYATYNIWPIYNDTHTIAFRKGSSNAQIISVFTNVGSTNTNYAPWTLTLASGVTGWIPGTDVVEVLSCTKLTISPDGSLAVKMQKGLPKVYFSAAAAKADRRICNGAYTVSDAGDAAPSETRKSVATAGLRGKKKKAVAIAGIMAYHGLNT